MSGVKEYIDTNLYDDNKKSYVRNTEDKKMDISIIEQLHHLMYTNQKKKEY